MTRSRYWWILALALPLLPACDRPQAEGIHVVVDESLGALPSGKEFEQRFVNSFGEDCGMVPEISSEKLPDGTLRIVAFGTNHRSSEDVTIYLSHGKGGVASATIDAEGYFDGNDVHYGWTTPRGKVAVSSLDWTALSSERPLYVQFELDDAHDPAHRHATGFIRLPR